MKISQDIRNLVPYRPGKPIDETKRELGLSEVCKLASNENPLPPSPRVVEAVTRALSELNRYPDASCFELKQAMCNYYQLNPEFLTFGNGSNELIDLLVRVFCEPGDAILTSHGAFIAYKICAQAARVRTIETPLTKDLRFDLQAMRTHLKTEGLRLVFIANPNNPTGTYIRHNELVQFMDEAQNYENILVVIDEAYLEFVRAPDYPQTQDLFAKYPNLVILRTMSKVFGLASLRVGALIAPVEVIDYINRVRNPFNVNSLAQIAGIAALSDREYLAQAQQVTWQGLDFLCAELSTTQLPYCPSQANFVLFDSLRDSRQVFEAFLKRGVIVRPVDNYGFKSHIRISVGLPEENKKAVGALKQVLQEVSPLKG